RVEPDDSLDPGIALAEAEERRAGPASGVSALRHRSDLGDHDRLLQARESPICRAEDLVDALPPVPFVRGTPVETRHRDPVDVAVARVEPADVATLALKAGEGVDRPDPAHVRGTCLGEEVVDVAPGGDEGLRGVSVGLDRPRIPVSVHLVHEAN